jgi:glycosyltransferase involved in cell wall biosynthesis
VVIAAYNRSNVLRFAIATVLAQTLEDWELWVIGDACTDDTEEVVASFGDERLHFVNLERNVGEQSGPNNEGFRRSRGSLIAYLGQDDLWLFDHLERCVRSLEQYGCDFVFSLADEIWSDGSRRLLGATPTGRFEPWMRTVPSTWVVRRDALAEIGPWRSALELYATPQEDLTARLHRAGRDMRLVPFLTVIKIPAGVRELSYSRRVAAENELFFRRLQDEPDFRERELTLLALRHAAEQATPRPLHQHLVRWAKDAVRRASSSVGAPPFSVHNAVRFRRKGGGLDYLRRVRGLAPLERGNSRAGPE